MKMTFAILIIFLGATCATKKEVVYVLPEAMLPHVKVQYANQCEKGYKLWQKNCAECHTKKIKRKEIIPDFRQDQLIGYALRIKNQKHEANLQDSLVSEEDLGIIMTFLTYKKKNK